MIASAVQVKSMSFASKLSQRVPVPLLLLSVLAILMPQLASAQTLSAPTPSLEPSLEPLEIELLKPDAPLAGRNIVTATTINQTQINTPSLWWAKEQFDQFKGKLINNWIAYQDKKRVDLVVNRQLWSILNYLDRYRFLNEFGTVARDYQYNVRVFDQQADLLGTYTCDYTPTLPSCKIEIFDSFGQESLQIPRQ